MEQKTRSRSARHALRLTERRIAELLQNESAVTPEQLVEAMSQKKSDDETVGEALVSMGLLNEKVLAEIIATQIALPYLSLANYSIPKEILEGLDPDYLRKKRIMPLDRVGDVLLVAFAGVMDEQTVAELEQHSGCVLFLCVTTLSDIDTAIKTYFSES